MFEVQTVIPQLSNATVSNFLLSYQSNGYLEMHGQECSSNKNVHKEHGR